MDGHLRAVIDIGSNTIRLLVATVQGNTIHQVLDNSRFVRLGAGVAASGALDPERKQAGIEAIHDLLFLTRAMGCNDIRAVATSAVRDASDGREYVERIRDETGLDVRILTGDEEAQLMYMGATVGIELASRNLLCDLGGGSCEVILSSSTGIEWAQSLQLGSGRMTEKFMHHDPPEPEEGAALQGYVFQSLSERASSPNSGKAIFTGGTASNIAFLLSLDGDVMLVNLASLREVERKVYSLPAAEIAQKFEVRGERAAVLPAGVTTIRSIAEWSGATTLAITRHGIREGVMLAPWPPPLSSGVRSV